MQLTTLASATPRPAAIAPGSVVGVGRLNMWDADRKASVQFDANVTVGAVLRAGVRDIQTAAFDLMTDQHQHGHREYSGLVGFVRNGDAWDAVSLLAPELPGKAAKALWSVGDLQALRVADGVQLDAIWQVSDFGYDLRWGTPDSMVPPLP
jgi:hypothetical protein